VDYFKGQKILKGLIIFIINFLARNLMKKNLTKIITFLVLITLSLTLTVPVLAQTADQYFPEGNSETINVPGSDGDVDENTLSDVVVQIINIVLGLLGLIAVIIVLIGGFEWMTAGGDDDKVGNAKKRLQYGLTGLVIIFLAYIIVRFVIGQLTNVLL